jgi:cytochrome c peroxidase
MKNRPYYFWDGRAGSLEAQALMPIKNPDEMALPLKQLLPD